MAAVRCGEGMLIVSGALTRGDGGEGGERNGKGDYAI